MIYIQLIGILAFCVMLLSFYKKKTSTIIAYQIISNLAYTIHYLLLGALSGSFISIVGVFRNILLLRIKKHKNVLAAIIIFIYLLITIIFYENYSSILPMIANSQYLISMLRGTKKSMLIGGLISSSLWFTYGVFVSSYASMLTESILLISNSIQLIKLNKNISK